MDIFRSAENARAYLSTIEVSGAVFEIRIADDFTIAGSPDVTGAGMALIGDALLGQGYEPSGFEQRDGYRVYRFVPMND